MITAGEWIDKVHEITDELERNAEKELENSVKKAQAYKEGYVQACEDFNKRMRRAISNEQG